MQLEIIIISKTVNSETPPSKDEEISCFIVWLRILKNHVKTEYCAKVTDKRNLVCHNFKISKFSRVLYKQILGFYPTKKFQQAQIKSHYIVQIKPCPILIRSPPASLEYFFKT